MQRCLFIILIWSVGVFGNVYSNILPTITEPVILIPSPALPSNIKCNRSNNNVDMISYKGRYYIAWRTAANHFPSKSAVIYVISSGNFKDWTYEHTFTTGADLREPRFLVFKEKLFLYCFEGSKKFYSFNPQHIWISRFENQEWTDEVAPGLDGFVPWRLKISNDKALLSAYWGKELYGNHQAQLRLFTSEDGITWTPISEEPQVDVTGAEEGEFEFDAEGNLWSVVRLEGEGSLVGYAHKDSLHEWHTWHSKKKYDSSCMFRHKNEIYLLARRNKDGDASKAPKWFPESIKRGYNLTRYSLTAKTTALYKLNADLKDFEWVMDIPGCGDNAFPAITPSGENTYYVLNYTNELSDPEMTWLSGQFAHTYIYYLTLVFP